MIQQCFVPYSVLELHLLDQRITLLARSLDIGQYARLLDSAACQPPTRSHFCCLAVSAIRCGGQPGWRDFVDAVSVPRGNP